MAKVVKGAFPTPKLDDVVGWERATYSLGGAAPRYNPDGLVRNQGLKVYEQMRTDEQVKAVMQFRRDAVMGRGWQLSYDEGSKLPKEKKAERIRVMTALLRKKMEGSFEDGLNCVWTARDFGFSLTEKVYTQVEVDGTAYIGLRMLKRCEQNTFEFRTDDYGLLKECVQRVAGKEQQIRLGKFVYFVHQPEFDRYYGRSDLREAYRPWYIKQRIDDYWALYLERFAGGFLILTQEATSNLDPRSPTYAALQNVLTNLHGASGIILPKGITAQLLFPPATPAYADAITAKNLAIAKAMLTPNLLGLTEAGQTGAYAQSQTQLEAFVWTLNMDGNRMCAAIDQQILYDLGEQNWGDDDYPCFSFKPASMEHIKWVIEAWNALILGGAVVATEADEAKLRGLLDMPPREPDDKALVSPADQHAQQLATQGADQASQAQTHAQDLATRDANRADKQQHIDQSLGNRELDIKRIAAKAKKTKARSKYAFDPNEARDDHGRWSGEGGSIIAYHGTVDKFLTDIKERGLTVGNPRQFDDGDGELYQGDRGQAVFVTSQKNNAIFYARAAKANIRNGAKAVMLKLNIPKKEFDKFKQDDRQRGAAYTPTNIPRAWISEAYVVPPGGMNPELQRVEFKGVDGVETYVVVFVRSGKKFADDDQRTGTGVHGAGPTDGRLVVVPHGSLIVSASQFASATQRVMFSVIEAAQSSAEARVVEQVAQLVAQSVQRALGTDEQMADLAARPEDTVDVEFVSSDLRKIKGALRTGLADAWATGIDHARTEIDRAKQFRRTEYADLRTKASGFLEARSFRMAGDLSDGVRNVIQQELLNAVKSGRAVSSTREAIWARLVDKGYTTKTWARDAVGDDVNVQRGLDRLWVDTEEQAAAYLETLARTSMYEAMNEARMAEFMDPALGGFVVALQYSAVLDGRTSDICETLGSQGGVVFATDSEFWDVYRPPNHFNCRSILTPITQADGWDGQESDDPGVEPAPGFNAGEK